MNEKPKKVNKTEVIMTRLTKDYDNKLNRITLKNKRNKADMVRIIIENYIDMMGELV